MSENENEQGQEQAPQMEDPVRKAESTWDRLSSAEDEKESHEEVKLEKIVEYLDYKAKQIDNVTKGSNKFAQAYYTVLDSVGMSSKSKRLEKMKTGIEKTLAGLNSQSDANESVLTRLEKERDKAYANRDAAKVAMSAYERCKHEFDVALQYVNGQANELRMKTRELKDDERNLEDFYANMKNINAKLSELREKSRLAEKRYEKKTRDIVKFNNKGVRFEGLIEMYRKAQDKLENAVTDVENAKECMEVAAETGGPTESIVAITGAEKDIAPAMAVAGQIQGYTIDMIRQMDRVKQATPSIATLSPAEAKLRNSREKVQKEYEKLAHRLIDDDLRVA